MDLVSQLGLLLPVCVSECVSVSVCRSECVSVSVSVYRSECEKEREREISQSVHGKRMTE